MAWYGILASLRIPKGTANLQHKFVSRKTYFLPRAQLLLPTKKNTSHVSREHPPGVNECHILQHFMRWRHCVSLHRKTVRLWVPPIHQSVGDQKKLQIPSRHHTAGKKSCKILRIWDEVQLSRWIFSPNPNFLARGRQKLVLVLDPGAKRDVSLDSVCGATSGDVLRVSSSERTNEKKPGRWRWWCCPPPASQPPQKDAGSGGHRHVLPLMCVCSAVVAGEVRLPGVESWLKFDKETPFPRLQAMGRIPSAAVWTRVLYCENGIETQFQNPGPVGIGKTSVKKCCGKMGFKVQYWPVIFSNPEEV